MIGVLILEELSRSENKTGLEIQLYNYQPNSGLYNRQFFSIITNSSWHRKTKSGYTGPRVFGLTKQVLR